MSAGFDAFWDLYGKKVNRPDAQKAWKQMTTPGKDRDATPPDVILAGLRAHLDGGTFETMKEGARRQGYPDKQFVPYPASWLRAEGWSDEIVPRVRPVLRNGAAEALARHIETNWAEFDEPGSLIESTETHGMVNG